MNTLLKRTNGNGNMPTATFSGLVDKLFQNNFNRFSDDDFWGVGSLPQNLNVPVNIRETDKSYEIELVSPGLKKEDFKVNVNGETLTIAFEHQDEQTHDNKEQGWLRKEYQKRSFTRTFSLDDAMDAGKIEAKYADGILHLSLPKKEGAHAVSRTIEIR
jgi:HSP20 family protein